MKKRSEVFDAFKRELETDDLPNVRESVSASGFVVLKVGERKEGMKSIRISKYLSAPNYGFPVPGDYKRDEERRRWKSLDNCWRLFIQRYPLDTTWKSNKIYNQLQYMITQIGISPKHRPFVWMKISGAFEYRERNLGYYESILKTHRHFPLRDGVKQHIDKDLKRTFPEHPYFGCDDEDTPSEGRTKMRRILLAYSWRNPLISYCQSFNYIVGMLLLHFESEEDVFWMFVNIIENLLPSNYFDENLKGIQADSNLFDFLLKIYVPEIYAFFQSDAVGRIDPGSFIVSGWFMSIFLTAFNCKNPNHVLRVWDCFFLDGPVALYRITLSFFKKYSESFRKIKNFRVLEIVKTYPKEKIIATEYDNDYQTFQKKNWSVKKKSRSLGASVGGGGFFGSMAILSDEMEEKKEKVTIKELIVDAYLYFVEVVEDNYIINLSSIKKSKNCQRSFIKRLRRKYFIQIGLKIQEKEDKRKIQQLQQKQKKQKKKVEETEGEEEEEEFCDESKKNQKYWREYNQNMNKKVKKLEEVIEKQNEKIKKLECEKLDLNEKILEMEISQCLGEEEEEKEEVPVENLDIDDVPIFDDD